MTDDVVPPDEAAPSDNGGSDDGAASGDALTAGRLRHHQQLLADGAYPYRFDRSSTAEQLQASHGHLAPGETTDVEVTVAGRVVLLRSFGKLVFATVRDGSGTIQLFVDRSHIGDDEFARFATVDLGDWVGASGEVMTTRKGELSVRIDTFELLQKSLRPLPDKWHGLQDVELRSRQRYVDLIANEDARRVAVARAAIIAELRKRFTARGYIEVETPVLLSLATGGLARPFSTEHHALGLAMYLRIATELYLKRLIVGGLERVFEVGRIFRNEGIDATHFPEFTMLESYEAFADYTDIMALVEEVFPAAAVAAGGSPRLSYQGKELNLTPPFRRARMVDLVAEAISSEIDFGAPLEQVREIARQYGVESEPHWGHGKIIEALFDHLVAPGIWEPTFVLDHPVEVSPLARRHRENQHLTERFELFIAGDEYANAFSELNDPIDQRARFEAQVEARAGGDDEAHPIDEDYLLALEYGLPPTGGLGIGVDRLVMLLTDKAHIREVILFPTMRPEA